MTTLSNNGEEYFHEIISRQPVLLFKEKKTCPVCGKNSLELSGYLYEVDYFGSILITQGICRNCGYRFSDVRLAEISKPKKIIVKIYGEKELRYLLVKSAYASVVIVEKGFEMIPGPASTGFITTVEGILHRFLEATETLCKSVKNQPEEAKCKEAKEWLLRAIDGDEVFTLVICDFEGASKVVGENVIEEDIDEFCKQKKPEWLAYL